MKDETKPLSLRQAQSCENAQHPTCRCRCGGRLHGAMRHMTGIPAENGPLTPNEEFFAMLPPDDPHFRETQEQRRARLRREREAAQERKWQLLGSIGSRHGYE